MLAPVFDFKALNQAEAYAQTLPPKVQDAIKNHKVLVGMDRDMVIYAKGRPQKKIRDKDDDGQPYEEWIYGSPPEEVDFVRFQGDLVCRLEIMTVDGEKIVRTQKEVDIQTAGSEVAQKKPEEKPASSRRLLPPCVGRANSRNIPTREVPPAALRPRHPTLIRRRAERPPRQVHLTGCRRTHLACLPLRRYTEEVRIALGQINTLIGDFSGNSAKIIDYSRRARSVGADLILFPELSVCGYPPRDLVERPVFVERNRQATEAIAR